MLVKKAFGHFEAGALDGVSLFRVFLPYPQSSVGLSARQLDLPEGADEFRMNGPAGQGKVFERPCRMDPVEPAFRDQKLAKKIMLCSICTGPLTTFTSQPSVGFHAYYDRAFQ
jgi:hypothetical protein